MSFNILKHGVGQLNKVVDLKGKTQIRQEKLFVMVGENNIQLVEQVYDPDHFLYQRDMPITKSEYEYYRTHGGVPKERLGNNVLCTCGGEGVIITDPSAPSNIVGKLMCQNVAQFGIHQTGMIIKDGKMSLPSAIAQDKLLTDAEMEKLWGKKE